jgi:hypothetical protein
MFMALVYLLSTAPPYDPASRRGSDELRRLCDAARVDRFKAHRMTCDPALADLIMFVDAARPDLVDIRRHPLYTKYVEKCFAVHDGDRIYPFLPGIYACAERQTHAPTRSSTGCYLTVTEDAHFSASPDYGPTPLLYSFVGRSETAAVRQRLVRLRGPDGLLLDTSVQAPISRAEYARIIRQSRFVLCPRGYGSSSYRVFEALKSGRAPVVLSDDWIPPEGPDWRRFAVFVPESKAGDVPGLLSSLQPYASEMGLAARRAWDDWFSAEAVFHTYVEACLRIMQRRHIAEKWGRYLARAQRLRPALARRLARVLPS